jgi:hypothetical protein
MIRFASGGGRSYPEAELTLLVPTDNHRGLLPLNIRGRRPTSLLRPVRRAAADPRVQHLPMLAAPVPAVSVPAVLHPRRRQQGMAGDPRRGGAIRRGVRRADGRVSGSLGWSGADSSRLGPGMAKVAHHDTLRRVRRIYRGEVHWRNACVWQKVRLRPCMPITCINNSSVYTRSISNGQIVYNLVILQLWL